MPKYSSPYVYRYCAICGKHFPKLPGSIYKLEFAGKTQHFCCYTCYKRGKETKENVNEAFYKSLKSEENT